jgi:serine/threonine-protein kinase
LPYRQLQVDSTTIVRILLQVAYAVGWLHGHGFVHMDLKCDNILVDLSDPSKPTAMLADLGLDKFSRPDWFAASVGTCLW